VKRRQVVFADGKWNGKALRDWLPVAIEDIVRQFDPLKVIVFGSVARGEEESDSDLDLLVVFDRIDKQERPELMGRVRFAITAPVPCDVIVTDVEELERRKDVNGSMLYWPAREGRVVYERAVA